MTQYHYVFYLVTLDLDSFPERPFVHPLAIISFSS